MYEKASEFMDKNKIKIDFRFAFLPVLQDNHRNERRYDRMKTKIVIGCIAAVFLLMMLPSVSAVEFNTTVESNRSQILEQIRSMDINEDSFT